MIKGSAVSFPRIPRVATFLARFKNTLVLLVVVLAQTLWLATQVHPNRPVLEVSSGEEGRSGSLLRQWAMTVANPVERGAHGGSSAMRRLWNNYLDLRHTRQQNADLRREVARLRLEQASFVQDAAEGRRLQALLAFKQRYVRSTVAAEVIGTSGSDRSHVLWLNKGSVDGLQPEQPVITPDGVVGKLREVMPHTAQLLLINDANSGAGVVLQSTRLRGIVRGTSGGAVEINNLTADDRIKAGEAVVTSGGDQIFPRGLPVGTVTSVGPDPRHPPFLQILLKPAANLARLEEVLVITGTDATPSAAAESDAAQAEALALENQRAADLVAARLPGLHDVASAADKATGTDAKAPPDATSDDGEDGSSAKDGKDLPAAHVKPPVHADRYSPGATPPATELTPGAPKQ